MDCVDPWGGSQPASYLWIDALLGNIVGPRGIAGPAARDFGVLDLLRMSLSFRFTESLGIRWVYQHVISPRNRCLLLCLRSQTTRSGPWILRYGVDLLAGRCKSAGPANVLDTGLRGSLALAMLSHT